MNERRWRRRFLLVVVAALLGVVTTVMVAWGAAWRGRFESSVVDRSGVAVAKQVWAYQEQRGPGLWRVHARLWGDVGESEETVPTVGPVVITRSAAHRLEELRRLGWPEESWSWGGRVWFDEAAGWPMAALRSESVVNEGSGEDIAWVGETRWGVRLRETQMPASSERMWVLPLRPIWSGIAVNTGVFGAAWWVVLASPGLVRRCRRRRGGRCEGCGYDLAGQSEGGCPECGLGREGSAA